MAELIKKFIVWYLCHRRNAYFEYNGKVVRVFSEEFYNTEARDYINAAARARHNTRTLQKKDNKNDFKEG